jgi:putative ABC transport system substrate-binding protein
MGIRRRRFLALLGGVTAMSPILSWPRAFAANRTVGFLLGLANDVEAQTRVQAFEQGLRREGWSPGRDVNIEYRYASGDARRMHMLAKELVARKPDVIVGHSTPVVRALLQETHDIPIVFVVVADPVGDGFAESIPRPGANATGFTNLNASITGKLLTILKQISPGLTRVGLMLNPDTGVSNGLFYLRPFETAAPAFAVEAIPMPVRTPADIELRMAELAREPSAGLIVMPDNFLTVHRELIISSAAKWRIPAIYPYRYFVEAGGLMSYGVHVVDLFSRASEYVARILDGAKPGELPIQAPTKFEFVINLRTARALNIEVPKILIAGADSILQ